MFCVVGLLHLLYIVFLETMSMLSYLGSPVADYFFLVLLLDSRLCIQHCDNYMTTYFKSSNLLVCSMCFPELKMIIGIVAPMDKNTG